MSNGGVLVRGLRVDPQTYVQDVNGLNTVKLYGAVGNGSADDRAAIAAADAVGGFILPPGTYRLSTDLTINNTINSHGGGFTIDSGVTLTISGKQPDWPPVTMFAGDGDVVFETGSVSHLRPEWWGACGDLDLSASPQGDGATVNDAAFDACEEAVRSLPDGTQKIMRLTGSAIYYLTTTRNWSSAASASEQLQFCVEGDGALLAFGDMTPGSNAIETLGNQFTSHFNNFNVIGLPEGPPRRGRLAARRDNGQGCNSSWTNVRFYGYFEDEVWYLRASESARYINVSLQNRIGKRCMVSTRGYTGDGIVSTLSTPETLQDAVNSASNNDFFGLNLNLNRGGENFGFEITNVVSANAGAAIQVTTKYKHHYSATHQISSIRTDGSGGIKVNTVFENNLSVSDSVTLADTGVGAYNSTWAVDTVEDSNTITIGSGQVAYSSDVDFVGTLTGGVRDVAKIVTPTHYDGVYDVIEVVDDNNFILDVAYVADETSGDMYGVPRDACLIEGASARDHRFYGGSWNLSTMTEDTADTYGKAALVGFTSTSLIPNNWSFTSVQWHNLNGAAQDTNALIEFRAPGTYKGHSLRNTPNGLGIVRAACSVVAAQGVHFEVGGIDFSQANSAFLDGCFVRATGVGYPVSIDRQFEGILVGRDDITYTFSQPTFVNGIVLKGGSELDFTPKTATTAQLNDSTDAANDVTNFKKLTGTLSYNSSRRKPVWSTGGADASKWVYSDGIRIDKSVNVLDHGAVLDGTSHPLSEFYATLGEAQADYPHATALTDEVDWAAIQLVVNNIPSQITDSNAEYGAGTVYVPSILYDGTAASAVINQQINIPATRSVFMYTDAPQGARLEWTGAAGTALLDLPTRSGGGEYVVVSGFTFDGGGIQVDSTFNGHFAAERCAFVNCTGASNRGIWFTAGSGTTIYMSRVLECSFDYCENGIVVDAGVTPHLDIDRCRFEKCGETHITCASDGIKITNSEFFGIDNSSSADCMIWLKEPTDGVISSCIISNNRFGPEEDSSSTYDHPTQTIKVFDTGATSGSIELLRIKDNNFRGATSATPSSSTRAKHAIVFHARPVDSVISNNEFNNYADAIVNEAWYETATGNSVIGRSLWQNNGVQRTWDDHPSMTSAKIFSHNGIGWEPQPINAPKYQENLRNETVGQNLLVDANLLSSTWSDIGCTVAQDVAGPDGTANAAWSITYDGASNNDIYLRQIVTGVTEAGVPATFAFWAKAGTVDLMRVGFFVQRADNTYRPVHDESEVFHLTDEWQRYEVTCPYMIDGSKNILVRLHIANGEGTVPAFTGGESIHVFMPGLFKAFRAPQTWINADTGDSQPVPPWQSLALGYNIVGYGAAAPTSGEYKQGDIWINNAATTGYPWGWYCETSGGPGTWSVMGIVGVGLFTDTQLEDSTHAVNTTRKYYRGLGVYCTTDDKMVFASGTGATDTWVDSAGLVQYTPIP